MFCEHVRTFNAHQLSTACIEEVHIAGASAEREKRAVVILLAYTHIRQYKTKRVFIEALNRDMAQHLTERPWLCAK